MLIGPLGYKLRGVMLEPVGYRDQRSVPTHVREMQGSSGGYETTLVNYVDTEVITTVPAELMSTIYADDGSGASASHELEWLRSTFSIATVRNALVGALNERVGEAARAVLVDALTKTTDLYSMYNLMEYAASDAHNPSHTLEDFMCTPKPFVFVGVRVEDATSSTPRRIIVNSLSLADFADPVDQDVSRPPTTRPVSHAFSFGRPSKRGRSRPRHVYPATQTDGDESKEWALRAVQRMQSATESDVRSMGSTVASRNTMFSTQSSERGGGGRKRRRHAPLINDLPPAYANEAWYQYAKQVAACVADDDHLRESVKKGDVNEIMLAPDTTGAGEWVFIRQGSHNPIQIHSVRHRVQMRPSIETLRDMMQPVGASSRPPRHSLPPPASPSNGKGMSMLPPAQAYPTLGNGDRMPSVPRHVLAKPRKEVRRGTKKRDRAAYEDGGPEDMSRRARDLRYIFETAANPAVNNIRFSQDGAEIYCDTLKNLSRNSNSQFRPDRQCERLGFTFSKYTSQVPHPASTADFLITWTLRHHSLTRDKMSDADIKEAVRVLQNKLPDT